MTSPAWKKPSWPGKPLRRAPLRWGSDPGNVQRGAILAEAITDANRAAGELRVAFNAFSRSAAVQSIALTDGDLRTRVRNHARLAGLLCVVAERGGGVGPRLSDTVRLHADAVIEAIDAHVNDQRLPSYIAPRGRGEPDEPALPLWAEAPDAQQVAGDEPYRKRAPTPAPAATGRPPSGSPTSGRSLP
jgi:hypothetical protein